MSTTVAVTLAKSCCRCRVKLEKILCSIQEGCGFVFDKVEYDNAGKVMITGTFDALELCCKIKCKARCFVTKVEIVPPKEDEKAKKEREKKEKEEKEKKEKEEKERKEREEREKALKNLIPYPYPYYTYPYPCPQEQPACPPRPICPTPPCPSEWCKPKPPPVCRPPPPPPPPACRPQPPCPCPTCRPPCGGGYPRDCYEEPDDRCTVM